jgi:hypothetical protein
VAARGRQPNLSFFAFTATPKARTLELVGRRDAEGNHASFHLYTMRQAIEEGFILDVLANYVTYATYWKVGKAVADDPEYDTRAIAWCSVTGPYRPVTVAAPQRRSPAPPRRRAGGGRSRGGPRRARRLRARLLVLERAEAL